MTLWSFFQSIKFRRSPQRRIYIIPQQNQRASFCIWHRGSYTLEAAVVIPLLAGYLVTLLFFFQIIQIQCAIDEALLYAGRKTAVESTIVDSEEALLVSAEGFLLDALKDNTLVEKRVAHGLLGIGLWDSQFNGEEIVLKAQYSVKLPIHFWGIGQVELTSQNSFRKWNGENATATSDEMVYITPEGEVYHSELSCRSLKRVVKIASLKEVENLRGLNGQKYYECTFCDWKNTEKGEVYYTDYGVLYHKDISCSSLKRTIEKVSLDDVGNRRSCKFCSEE